MDDENSHHDDHPRDPRLDAPLASLRQAMNGIDTPRGVEKELMAAYAKQFPRRRWFHALSPRQWRLAGGAGSIAMVAVLAVMMPHLPAPVAPGEPLPVPNADGPAFIALQPIERIEQETNPRMLETDLPRSSLASLGLPVNPEDAGDSVRAEMLVAADGSPLALRLVVMP